MIDIWHDLAMRRTIGAQLVGNHPLRRDALLLQKSSQQSLGRLGIAAGLDDLVKHIAILINSAPQPVFPAGNGDDHLVEMPHVIPAGLLAMKATCIVWAELLYPAADRFIGDDNATLQQHFFDKTQAQRKSEVEPHCVCDDLGRETMALVADG
ncbi:hypothetical protein C7374_12138 [Falsochrobactrum ovis]|uniref:Uncharacterized protein n=1 Tax=Falsochrobactrum ovis TaxID=1293442 RepID=A0A364JRZ7_9HYPH|nr:hypothetical protein C7374_12138 [Falsochrobactrum ovis]